MIHHTHSLLAAGRRLVIEVKEDAEKTDFLIHNMDIEMLDNPHLSDFLWSVVGPYFRQGRMLFLRDGDRENRLISAVQKLPVGVVVASAQLIKIEIPRR